MVKLSVLFDFLKRSLWFIPLLMTISAFFLAIGLDYLDSFFWKIEAPYLGKSWGVNIESAKSLLISVSAAVITAMTTILSITLLIFTVLAGQYGAHVLRVFKVQTFSKFVIGWFSGTYLYIIYHVYTITMNDNAYIPQISITLAAFFTIATIFLLIFYIHFLVKQIQVGTVVSETALGLCNLIRSMDKKDVSKSEIKRKTSSNRDGRVTHEVSLNTFGYLQSRDKDKLVKISKENDLFMEIMHRSGDFIVTGETSVIVYSRDEIAEEIIDKIRECFILGEKRVPVDDSEYQLEILTEMVLKALSPGVNNIIVANSCIDYLGESFALLVTRQFPDSHVYDDNEQLLLINKEFSFKGFLNSALNPIRQYATDHCSVLIRLMDNLIKASRINQCETYRTVITEHFMAIYETATAHHNHELDQECIKKRYQQFLESTQST